MYFVIGDWQVVREIRRMWFVCGEIDWGVFGFQFIGSKLELSDIL